MTDHLTSKDAIDFWRRYFQDYNNSEVPLDDFFEAIQSEYATLVFKSLLDDLPPNSVAEEDLVQDFYADLQNKVSIDQEYVSLNALELFCRKNGLQRAVRSLFEDSISRHRAQRSIKLNDTIVQELSDVKVMLDHKSKQLAQKEVDLRRREHALTKEKLDAARDLDTMYQKKLSETEKRFNKEC